MLNPHDMVVGARFLLRLPFFFNFRLDEATARKTAKQRLANQERNFLGLVRQSIFNRSSNPYRRLLDQAGMAFPDIEKLVQQEGLSGALEELFKQGVYLTVDEFKGRTEVVRGSFCMQVYPNQLRNPRSRFHVPALTSGSGGKATPVLLDLDYLREQAVNTLLKNLRLQNSVWRHAQWLVPGGLGIALALEYSLAGLPPQRWFSPVDPANPEIHVRYRGSAQVMRLGASLAGVRLPRPEYVPFKDPAPIVAWLQGVLAQGQRPHLRTMVSSALGLCRWAQARHIDLSGVVFSVSGEPLTATRQKVINASGARAMPIYAAMEVRYLGLGCLNPQASDDVHVLSDCNAVIQPGSSSAASGLPPDAVLVSTLLHNAPFILINYAPGDRADFSRRECGCYLQEVGWRDHLESILSYEKMTAGGINFLDYDLVQILEEALPRLFGGNPNDYQLVEEEGPDGEPALRLLVNPKLGDLDSQRLRETFINFIGNRGEAERVMGQLLQETGYLKVERKAPLTTASGKILHLHKRFAQNIGAKAASSAARALAAKAPAP